MVLIVKDEKRSNVCVEMEWAQKFDRYQLGSMSQIGDAQLENQYLRFT
jgi:hypothetical protein